MKKENYYETMMDALQPPAHLKNKVLQEAQALKAAESQGRQKKLAMQEQALSQSQPQTQSKGRPQSQPRLQNLTAAVKRQTAKRPRFKFGFAAAAACLSVFVLAVGSILVAQSQMGGTAFEPAAGMAGDNGKFSLQAYASEPDTAFASDDDLVLFGGMQGSGSASSQGMWTGNLFEITGKGIASVEASLSKGQLYLYAEEDYLRSGSEDPLTNREAAKLRIADKLKGQVDPLSENDSSWDFDENDSNKVSHFTASGARLLGSTFSLACGNKEGAVDLSQVKFGFFVNGEDLVNDDAVENLQTAWHSSVDAFDGQTLHITVKFDDGTQSSKSYVLHSGKMKIEWQGEKESEDGGWLVLPELAGENESYLYALYATVAN